MASRLSFWVQWLITAIAVAFTVWILPDYWIRIGWQSNALIAVAVMSLILALLNAFIKPFLQFLSCGFMIVTLGLFSLVINAALIYFSAWVCNTFFGIDFYVYNFWGAFWAGIIISVVTMFLSMFVGPKETTITTTGYSA